VHVATYKEGEKEPGYWDEVDTQTHKARLWSWFFLLVFLIDNCSFMNIGVLGLL
jgi:hypothetical protein